MDELFSDWRDLESNLVKFQVKFIKIYLNIYILFLINSI